MSFPECNHCSHRLVECCALMCIFSLIAGWPERAAARQAPPEWELVWVEDFDGPELDPADWDIMIGDGTQYGLPPGWGNNELQYYTARPENIFVSDGRLHIVAWEEDYEGYEYTSARIRTIDRHDFLYGRMEARIQLPTGQGMWPAFWMLPTDQVYGGWAASGEIDIMEAVNIPLMIYGTIHYGGSWPNNTHSGGTYFDGTDYSQDFHTFAIQWELDRISWYVDDVLYHFEFGNNWYSENAPENPRAPFDQCFHFLLNVAVGGNFPGPPNDSTSFPQEMLVDWVRVFQQATCSEDLNNDWVVDAADLAELLGTWGSCSDPCEPGDPATTCAADLTGDCDVGGFDLAILLGAWSSCLE